MSIQLTYFAHKLLQKESKLYGDVRNELRGRDDFLFSWSVGGKLFKKF